MGWRKYAAGNAFWGKPYVHETGCYYWVMSKGWSTHCNLCFPINHCWQMTNTEEPGREALWMPAARGWKRILIDPYPLWPWVPVPLHTWCFWGPCHLSSHATSMPSSHCSRPKSSRAASRGNSCGWPTCRGGDKTTIELQEQHNQGRGSKAFPPIQPAYRIHRIN